MTREDSAESRRKLLVNIAFETLTVAGTLGGDLKRSLMELVALRDFSLEVYQFVSLSLGYDELCADQIT